MLASLMTVGRRKITSSVFVVVSLRFLNRLPKSGILPINGISSESLSARSSIRPPSTAIWLFSIFSTDSISRVEVCGMVLVNSRSGVGSLTYLSRRVMDGRMLSSTVSLSLICGVTLMVKPIGTVLTVVVYAMGGVQGAAQDPKVGLTVKYTLLSTTRS